MPLRVVQAELLKTLDDQVGAFNASGYEIGLFKNDVAISDTLTIADITPCDYGGYTGLKPLASWPAATWVSPRAKSTHPAVTWTSDGTSTNPVHGYYVVDGDGELAWLEKRTGGAVVVGATAGETYTLNPVYTRRSEF